MPFDESLLEEPKASTGFDESLLELPDHRPALLRPAAKFLAGPAKPQKPGTLSVAGLSEADAPPQSKFDESALETPEQRPVIPPRTLTKAQEVERLATGFPMTEESRQFWEDERKKLPKSGPLQGLAEGFSEGFEGFPGGVELALADHDKAKEMLGNEARARQIRPDLTTLGKAGAWVGGLAGNVAGAIPIGGMGGPVGLTAGFASSGAYGEFINAGMKALNEGKTLDEATSIARKAALGGAVVGGVLGAVMPGPEGATMKGALKSGLKLGGVAGAGRVGENVLEQQLGLPTPTTEGALEEAGQMAALPPATAAAGKLLGLTLRGAAALIPTPAERVGRAMSRQIKRAQLEGGEGVRPLVQSVDRGVKDYVEPEPTEVVATAAELAAEPAEAPKPAANKESVKLTAEERTELSNLLKKDLSDDGLSEAEVKRMYELGRKAAREKRHAKTKKEADLLREAGVTVPDEFLSPSEGVENHITGWTLDKNGYMQIRVESHTSDYMAARLITVKPGDTLRHGMDDAIPGTTRYAESLPEAAPPVKSPAAPAKPKLQLTPVLVVGKRLFKGADHETARGAATKGATPDQQADALIAFGDDSQHMFRDEATGQLLTRQQAAKLFNEATGQKIEALQSSDLQKAGMLEHVGEAGELALKPLPDNTKITVSHTEYGGEKTSYFQADVPDAKAPGGSHSFGPDRAHHFGFKLDEDFTKLPAGTYTLAEARAKLAEAGEPPQPPAAPPAAPPEAPPAKPFFNDAEQKPVDDILARLREKLGGLGEGGALHIVPPEEGRPRPRRGLPEIDPEYFTLGSELAYHYVKAGVRKFGDFASHMIRDLGEKAKPYLLSWYSAARSKLTDIAHELDSEADAQKEYDKRFGTPQPVVDPKARPPYRVARQELVPKPSKEYIQADRYSAKSGFTLDPEQTRGVNLILSWFQKNPTKGGFLLADGPGFGKTAQCLAVVDQYQKLGMGGRILIVTQNKQIAEGRFNHDAERMGIDPSSYTITTYKQLEKMAEGGGGGRDWDLIVWDESHNLKNAKAQKTMAAARMNAKHELFATATPMDFPTGAAYFLSKITGEDYLEVARRLGFRYQSIQDPRTHEITEIPVTLPGVSWRQIHDNIINYRDAAVSAGAMIRREYPFFGKVDTVNVSMGLEEKMEHDRIAAHFDRLIDNAQSARTKGFYAGQKTLTLSRWSEQSKLHHAIDAALEHLKKGGQVVIVAETNNEQSFPQPVKDGVHKLKPNKWGQMKDVWVVDGAITQMKRMLAAQGFTDVANIHSPDEYNVYKEVEKFQDGKVRVALATPQSGGTGIDLDDVVGNRPRLMMVLSKNLAGDAFEQLVGRISRKNTKSESDVRFLNLVGAHGDVRRESILANKIRTLRTIQGGEDLDRAGGLVVENAPGGNRQVGFGGTEKLTDVPLEEGPEERIYSYTGGAPATTPPAGAPAATPPAGAPISSSPTTPAALNSIVNQRLPGLSGLQSLVAPSSMSPAHLAAAETLGKHLGAMHHRDEATGALLNRAGKLFDRLGVNRDDMAPAANPGLRFASDVSQGKPLTGPMKNIADAMNSLFTKYLAALEATGSGLETVRKNYFPGMWTKESRLAFNAAMETAIQRGILPKDFDVNKSTPAERAAVKAIVDQYLKDGTASEKDALAYLTRRPLAGKESFRKQKVFDDIMFAAEMGLRPISYNPIDLVKLKLAEMSRSIMMHGYVQELKGRGELKTINPYQEIPAGWEKLDDKYGTIYGPPTVKLSEYVDKAIYDGLGEVAKAIGVKHERVLSAGRGALGWASTSGKMVSQFATELSVMAHELGHQLDFNYDLWDKIVKQAVGYGAKGTVTKTASQRQRGIIQRELSALAKLTFEGYTVSEYYKNKVSQKAEKMAHMLEAYIHAKDLFKQTAPTVFDAFDTFIKTHPELKKLSELKQGLALQRLEQEKYVGLPIMGYRIVPQHVGDIVNNYTSSTLYNSRVFGGIYKAWMGAANKLNQSQLGMGSAFHAGFTTSEVTISAGANVLKDIYGVLRGNRSAGDLASSVGNSIIAAGRTPILGDKILNAWRNPDGHIDPRIAQVVRAAELAGGGFKMETGLMTEDNVKMMRDWYSGKRLLAAARSPFAAMELLAKPIMEYLVPRQKAGVFADLAWRIIDQNPGKQLEDLTPQFRQAWNRVDARLGQVRYDRLFMDNIAKNVVQATIRAPGWSGGTIAELGGGFKDAGTFFNEWRKTGKLPQNLPDRTAYVISLMAGVCTANALLTYAFSGQKPTGMDYWAFRTGQKDEHGNDERLVLPTYAKDILAYMRHPLETVFNKTHPIVSLVNEIFIKNKDYYGVEIRSRDSGIPGQVGQAITYAAKAFEPFWIRGARRERARDAGFARTAAPLVGVMPAPRSVTQTKAEGLAHDLLIEQIPSGPRTAAQAARAKAQAEERTPDDKTYLEHATKRLTALNAVRVFEKSSLKEQKLIGGAVWSKIWSARTPSDEERDALVERFHKANKTGQEY